MQRTFFFPCPFFSLLWCHTEQLYPCPHVLLLRIVRCSSNASLSVVEEVHHSGAAGECFALQCFSRFFYLWGGPLVFTMLGNFGRGWKKGEWELVPSTSCSTYITLEIQPLPVHLLCFQGSGQLGTGGVHESVLRSLGSFSTSPYCVARCIWELQCWDFWDSIAREEAFLPSPLELACSSLCSLGQAGTDQKPSAMQSTANKGHSSPLGQCLFCPTFACSCNWFIKNYSIFLLSFCTLNGQIFSLVILCWTPCICLHCF